MALLGYAQHDILDTLARSQVAMTADELAESTGRSVASARRALDRLTRTGAVGRARDVTRNGEPYRYWLTGAGFSLLDMAHTNGLQPGVPKYKTHGPQDQRLLVVRVSDEHLSALRDRAAAERRSVAEIVRDIVAAEVGA